MNRPTCVDGSTPFVLHRKGIFMRLRIPLVLMMFALAATAVAQAPEPPVLEIETRGHAFELSTREVASGWTTIRLRNASAEPHFAVFERMPEGRTMEDSLREVVPTFQEALDLINAGQVEEGFAALGRLPEWYGEVVFSGGPGMLSAGGTTEVTVRLEPGRYVIECYVKTEDGTFHSALGMIDEIVVTEEENGAEAPAAGVEITLRNPDPDDGSDPASGIRVDGEPASGPQIVAVHFDEEAPPLLGNDLHLVRLNDGQDVAEVAAWMDWSRPDGLATPAPAMFLGGTHEMPHGHTAYLTVELEPGRYAWVSERPANAPMYRVFEVR